MTKADVHERFAPFAEKMRTEGLSSDLIDLFKSYYEQILTGHTGMIHEEDIEPVQEGSVPAVSNLSDEDADTGRKALSQAVMIKLNGGLGTSMGLAVAKSLLKVRGDLTFLDITLLQASGCRGHLGYSVPLVLMNSFNTHKETLAHLEKHLPKDSVRPLHFIQHKYPKIMKVTHEPAAWPADPELEWNPPGHGDIYAALVTSGILDQLLSDGKRYAFVSNIDNLGAVLDLSILGHFVRRGIPFLMEAAKRTKSDTKGGHLARRQDGRLILREIAQCPQEALKCFQDITRYSYFNTNNIWLDLKKFKETVGTGGLPRLPLIVNPKTLDPKDESSPDIYQLETAMGAAITAFPEAGVIQIPRDRFIPVKKCNDLLAVRSDCYVFTASCELKQNPERKLGPVVIELDPRFYKKRLQLDERFPEGPPSLIACESLKVEGDVLFGKDVVCRGRVTVVNRTGAQAEIPEGTELEGDLVLE